MLFGAAKIEMKLCDFQNFSKWDHLLEIYDWNY